MAMSGPRCETCRYWAPDTNYIVQPVRPSPNLCHRWPDAVWKAPLHWCGEWLERDPQPWDVEQR